MGAELLDAVLRAVGNVEVGAIERAVVVGGHVGEKLQDAGSMRDHGFDFASAGAHLHFDILAAQRVGLAERPAGGRQRLGIHQTVSLGGHVRKDALLVPGFEIHLHAVGGDGGFGSRGGRNQPRGVGSGDLPDRAIVVEIH